LYHWVDVYYQKIIYFLLIHPIQNFIQLVELYNKYLIQNKDKKRVSSKQTDVTVCLMSDQKKTGAEIKNNCCDAQINLITLCHIDTFQG